jgi:SAM-dependent methyltransferase
MIKTVKRVAKRWLGRAEVASEGGTELSKGYYDGLYAASAEYRVPYWTSRYYMLWCAIAYNLKARNLRHVLEVGCGPGQFASMLFDRKLVDHYVGFDYSDTAIALARKTCQAGQFFVDDARTSDLYDGMFGAIICTEVLEHVTDDEAIVERFPVGTRCICTVPNFPYESHVRHFLNEGEVASRYAKFFHSFSVMGFRGHGSPALEYFVFEGVRH